MKFIDEARAYQDNMIEDLRQLVKIDPYVMMQLRQKKHLLDQTLQSA